MKVYPTVSDFLITIHIYEKCETLTPGDLTDLRSALVNNVTLSCISVRNQLHKFLLHNSNVLNDCMMRFVKHQEDRNHIIDNDILFLFEESDVNIAEAVDVPKSLGDIFEALIGAIYLDSGKNLDVTWKVVYNLMKDEIDKFHKDVPKNHVRMLYESECGPNFNLALRRTVCLVFDSCHNWEITRVTVQLPKIAVRLALPREHV
ncbi:deoxyribonuclease I activity protein [Homalodisca vitripennis]|nr:deoxyribonuclease I activity protein [Homalodisca vitripennis]